MNQEIAYPYIEGDRADAVATSLLSGVKSWLKLSSSNTFVDSEITLLINSALDYAEKYTRRFFSERTITTNRVFWGEIRNGQLRDYFTLRRSPLTEITSIKYDTEFTLSSTLYQVQKNPNGYGMIKLDLDNMPELEGDWFPIEITFKAGFTKIPNDIKVAIYQHVASLWLNRGDSDDESNMTVPSICKSVYKKYKIMEIGA